MPVLLPAAASAGFDEMANACHFFCELLLPPSLLAEKASCSSVRKSHAA